VTNPIFFAAAAELELLAEGSEFVLDGAEGRHATTVKRLAPGEQLDLVDGAGLRLSGTVTAASPGELRVRIERVSQEPAPAHRLVLVQALAKGDRDELAIEAATELGIDGVIPWQAERSIVRWKGERAAKSLAKWRATVRTAAKQARRARVPEVSEAVDSATLAALVAAAPLAVLLHEEAPHPLEAAVERQRGRLEQQPGAEILLIVGPEGGISAREVELLTSAGAQLARLGPHVLRSSTAGPAAVAVLSTPLGRW
jgi:16S rRNA (uracil1498-N3)-methyltransferase